MELIDEGLFDYSESANKLKKLIIKFSKNIKQEFFTIKKIVEILRGFIMLVK